MVTLSKKPYTISPEAVATFDSQDLATGLNFQNFYLMTTSLTGGAEYLLSDDTEYSGTIWTERSATGTTTLTFDSSEFNLARAVRGTAILSYGIGANSMNVDVTAQLKKWDGSSATNISAVITAAQWTAGASAAKMFLLQLPTTETTIATGEQLRLVITFETSSANVAELGHDPKGRAAGSYLAQDANSTTTTTIKVPFKLQ